VPDFLIERVGLGNTMYRQGLIDLRFKVLYGTRNEFLPDLSAGLKGLSGRGTAIYVHGSRTGRIQLTAGHTRFQSSRLQQLRVRGVPVPKIVQTLVRPQRASLRCVYSVVHGTYPTLSRATSESAGLSSRVHGL
jgi:hypothetical protein